MSEKKEKFLKRFKKIFTENRNLKLIALVITFGLFFSVRSQEKVERWIDVEVEVIHPDSSAGLVLTNKPISHVRVHIKGRHSVVDQIRSETSHVVKMDLSNIKKTGMTTYFFEPGMFNFSGVDIIDINPEAVSVRVENLVSRRLPVKVKTMGQLAEGTKFISEPTVDPSSVVAKGPASIIRSITFLETEEIGIDHIEVGHHYEEVPLVPTEGLSFSQDKFRVTFGVAEVREHKELESLTVKSSSDSNKSVELYPSEVTVLLDGPRSIIRNLDYTLVKALVYIDDLYFENGKKNQAKVSIEGLPEEVSIKILEPSSVEVRLLSKDQ